MKKLLFAALLATVAIGGATAQVYAPGATQPLPCAPGAITCAASFGTVGYTQPSPNQTSGNQVNLNDYSRTL